MFKAGDLVRHVDDDNMPARVVLSVLHNSVKVTGFSDWLDPSWFVAASAPYSTDFVVPAPKVDTETARRPENPKKAFGATKPDLALIPPVALLHMAMAYEDGARKYGAYNWRQDPVEAMTYISAAMRHLQNWLDGEEVTVDSLVHNLGCVMAGCGIVLDSQEQGILIDNRPPAGKSSEVQERLKAQKVAQAAERGSK